MNYRHYHGQIICLICKAELVVEANNLETDKLCQAVVLR